MHNTGEILQLCRLCLVKEQVNVPIFEGQGDVKQIFQKISSCLPVKINRSDKLPKNICDGCSEKLDLFYDFWNTSVNSEKQLLEWLGQTPLSAGAGTTIAAKNSKSTDPVQQIKVDVKQEPSDHTDNNESFQADASAVADEDETSFKSESGPPPKRARRAATKRKPITVAPDTDDDDDDDYEPVEPLTKLEDESGNSDNDNEDDSFANAPSTSADDQPGPSGIGKDGVEAPYYSHMLTPIVTIAERNKAKGSLSLANPLRKKRGRPKKSLDLQSIKKEVKEEADSAEEVSRKKTPAERKLALEERLRKKEYRLKLKEEEDNIRTVSCPICKDDIERTLKELKEHYKENHEGKRLRTTRYSTEQNPCDVCGKCFKTTGSLRDHMETHNNYFHCGDCNVAYKKIVDYIIHLRSHSDEGVFRCLLCEFITTEINDITSHVNMKHEKLDEGQKYWCGSCKKGFHIFSWFQEHENFHSGLKPYDCDLCGKCFMYSRYLHAHKNAMHKNETVGEFPSLHMCVICKKQYSHRNSLKLHMNSHTGNYAICDICGKILSSKEKLKFHIRTHTGYKPFKCPYCEKSFTKKPILVEHIRIHTGERPYVCEYCTKSFSQRSSLVIHIRSHTGEKPYVCHVCHKGFVAKAMLNIHLKACKGIFA